MGGSLVLGLDWLSNPQVSRDFGFLHKTAVLISAAVIPGGGGGATGRSAGKG